MILFQCLFFRGFTIRLDFFESEYISALFTIKPKIDKKKINKNNNMKVFITS